MYLRHLGLMASMIVVVPLGVLLMRDFQHWVTSLHQHRCVVLSAKCISALQCRRDPSLLMQGCPTGRVIMHKVVATECVTTGMGDEGRTVNGVYSDHLSTAHINILKLYTVLLALGHFRPFLRVQHVLVRSDNSSTVAYINCQVGTHSRQLHSLVREILLWSSEHLLSRRATHMPGRLISGSDYCCG